MPEENPNDKNFEYTIDQFVKIGEHIEKSQSAFIVADCMDKDGNHEVLMTAKGYRDSVVVMLVESMLKHQPINDLIQSAFISYHATVEARKKGN